jgi:hypothetical protein
MASYYAEQFSGDNYFGQSGTNIPSFGIQGGYAGGSSTDVPPYFGGYVTNAPAPNSFLQDFIKDQVKNQLESNELRPALAASPSFDLNTPYIPGQQDYTGIPNATPDMLRRLQQRKIVNPGGQELPGFLKPA